MSILDTFALHGLIKNELIPDISKRLEEGVSVEDALTSAGVTKEDILKGRGIYYNLPTRDLKGKSVPFDILEYIPEDSVSFYHFAPLGAINGVLEIGITDPENIEARDALQFIATKLGMPFKIFLISEDDLKAIIDSYRGLTGEVTKALSELEVDISDVDKEALIKKPAEKETKGEKKEAHVAEDAPVA
ncbi:MAG: hypothetical protein WBC83_01490, partial [Minisyncoccia bacterium]